MKEKRAPIISAVVLLLLFNAILTWYGRIYYPENFKPDEVTFYENFLVIAGSEVVVFLAVLAIVFGGWFLITEVTKDIKSWKK